MFCEPRPVLCRSRLSPPQRPQTDPTRRTLDESVASGSSEPLKAGRTRRKADHGTAGPPTVYFPSGGLLCGWLVGSTVTLLGGASAPACSQRLTRGRVPRWTWRRRRRPRPWVWIPRGWLGGRSGRGHGTGVDAVHVGRPPASGSPLFVGVASYGGSRPDVGALLRQPVHGLCVRTDGDRAADGTYTLVTSPTARSPARSPNRGR